MTKASDGLPIRRMPALPSSFLRSRLRPPGNPKHYLRRPRLLELLDETTEAPITLVVAPAGSGKTSLVVDWCSTASWPVAWVSLDETDRDGGQLWAAVAASLREFVGDHGNEVAWVSRPGALLDAVSGLVAELQGVDSIPVALVIDDIHLIDNDAEIFASLALFLNALPAWLHVVLVSRRTPNLPLDRLRARGQLGEVRFDELRFSKPEAEQLLSGLAPALTPEEVGAATEQVGGWAAGLQLTALAARTNRARAPASPVSTPELLFGDYIWHEVLSSEDPDVVEVLLDTCVVTRVNSAMAVALTGRADAGDLLLRAEARGLFVTRVGPSGWFEVHAVVRHELLTEAVRRSPSRVTSLHARAAQWFEDIGETAPALEHWLLACEPRQALRLLATCVADLYDTGREMTIKHTIARVPLNVATADLQTMMEFAWCNLLVDRRQFLDAVEQAAATADRLAPLTASLLGRLKMLESIAAILDGNWSKSGQLAHKAITDLGDDARTDQFGRFGWNMVAREVALSERWDDRSAELERVRRELYGDPERRLAYEGTRALGEVLAGRPVDALRIAAGVRDTASVHSMTILQAELAIAEATAHRELGDRPRAVSEFSAAAASDSVPVTHAVALAMLELSQLRMDEGDVELAVTSFDAAHDYFRREFSGPDGLAWLARTGTLVALASGEVDTARAWAEQIADPFWGAVSIARVLLHAGERDRAREVAEGAVPRSPRHRVVRDLILAKSAASPKDALDLAAGAAKRAGRHGLVQTVASEADGPLLELLERHPWWASKDWLDRVRKAASPGGWKRPVDPSMPGERLTERELEVLRILPSRLTLKEIAGELSISVNTLKFHLRVIYRKLGVGSRGEASVLARAMTSPALRRRT